MMLRRNRRQFLGSPFVKKIHSLLTHVSSLPIGILIIAAVIFFKSASFSPVLAALMPIAAYIVLLISLTLAFYFKRMRIFFLSFTLLLTQFGYSSFTPHYMALDLYRLSFYTLASCLLPINILLFSSVVERDVRSAWGRRYLFFIFLQIYLIRIFIRDTQDLMQLLHYDFITWPFAFFTPLPDAAMLFFLITALFFIYRAYRNPRPFHITMLLALFAVVFAQHYVPHNPMAMPIFYLATGVLFTISILQASYAMAYLDALTHLPARHALNEALLHLHGKYVIAMLDIDHFKKFNDSYGHDAGDNVLRFVASILHETAGDGKVFRYGGEEFAILFPNRRLVQVLPHLEQLCQHVAARSFVVRRTDTSLQKQQLTITISIGVAESNRMTEGPVTVMKNADAALYRAKNKGRNCVSE